jgi:hypothetical protein
VSRAGARPKLCDVDDFPQRLGRGLHLSEDRATLLQARDGLGLHIRKELPYVGPQAMLNGFPQDLTQIASLDHIEPNQLLDDFILDDAVYVEVRSQNFRDVLSGPMLDPLEDGRLEETFDTMTARDDLRWDVHIRRELIEICELGEAHVTHLDVAIHLCALRLAHPVLYVASELFVREMCQRLELARQLTQAAQPVRDPRQLAPAVVALMEVRVGVKKVLHGQLSQVITRKQLGSEMA